MVNVNSVLRKYCRCADRMLLFCFCNTITVSVWFVFRCVTVIAIVDELSWMHGHIFTLYRYRFYQLGWFVYTRRFNLYGLIDPDVTADVVAPC